MGVEAVENRWAYYNCWQFDARYFFLIIKLIADAFLTRVNEARHPVEYTDELNIGFSKAYEDACLTSAADDASGLLISIISSVVQSGNVQFLWPFVTL